MSGRLIVLEGIDGSGKGTQAERLVGRLRDAGRRVATLTFPQYEANRFGGMIGRFLNGEFGTLDAVPAELAALLFAGDRLESKPQLLRLLQEHDDVVLDRYVASNVAHQAGRVSGPRRQSLVSFLDWLEHELYGLPRPGLTFWLDLPVDVAAERIRRKTARSYTDRASDIQEENADHLTAAREVYAGLATAQAWHRVDTVPDGQALSAEEVTDRLVAVCET